MRELKFRCWDGIGNHGMQYFDDLQDIADHYRGHKYQAEMQYTGLKDKNGKEIYEGDIIFFNGFRGAVYYQDIGCRYVFDFADNIWALGWTQEKPKNLEVIGNIYENPELLT